MVGGGVNIFDDMDERCWVFVLLGGFNSYSRRNVPNFYISNLDNSLRFHYKISTKTWIKWINRQEDTGFGGKRGETIGGNQNVLIVNREAFS